MLCWTDFTVIYQHVGYCQYSTYYSHMSALGLPCNLKPFSEQTKCVCVCLPSGGGTWGCTSFHLFAVLANAAH